jgi:hypothetical protein
LLLGAREPLVLGATDGGGLTGALEGELFSADTAMLREDADADVLGRDDVVVDVMDVEYRLDKGDEGNDVTDPDSVLTSFVNGPTSRSSRTGAGLNRASMRDSVGRGPYARGRARMSKDWISLVPLLFALLIEALLDCKELSTGAYKSSARGRVRYTSSCVESRVATPARISPLGSGGAVNGVGVPTGSTRTDRRSVALVLLSRRR